MRNIVIVNMLCNDHGGIGTVMATMRNFFDPEDIITIVGLNRHPFEQKLGDDLFRQFAFDTETIECIKAFKEADIIISHQPMAHLGLQNYFPKNIPVIAFVHVDSQRMLPNDSEYGSSFHALNSKNFKADVVIVASEATKQNYRKIFPQHKIECLASNIKINEYEFDQFNGKERQGFIYLGRLEKNVKNVMEFIRMGELLRANNLYVDMYGRGIHQDEFFAALEEHQLQDVLRYKGVLDNSEVIENFGKYIAQISVSTCDCFPTIVLEGYKALTPIVLYNSFPSAVDMVADNETGYMVENGNIVELIEKLNVAQNRTFEEQTKMEKQIYDFRQRFAFEKLLQDFNEILERNNIKV